MISVNGEKISLYIIFLRRDMPYWREIGDMGIRILISLQFLMTRLYLWK